MVDLSFFRDTPSELWENIFHSSKELANIIVVGQDGKGWTSQSLLYSASPWIKELMSFLPPGSDHCVIFPDILWKDIYGLFQSQALLNSLQHSEPSSEVSADLLDMLKMSPVSVGECVPIQRESKGESKKTEDIFLNHCEKKEDFDNIISHDNIGQESVTSLSTKISKVRKRKRKRKKEEKVACELCGKLKTAGHLKRHMELIHYNKETRKPKKIVRKPKSESYSVSYTYKILKKLNSSSTDSYDLENLGITVYSCDECDKKCRNPKSLKIHKSREHPKCKQCQFTANGQEELKLHVLSIHEMMLEEKPTSCDLCDKKYTDPRALRRHKLSIHEGIRFPCDQCDFKARSKKSRRDHIDSIHKGIKISCDICNKVYSHPSYLKKHHISVHEGKFFLCDQCDYKGTQKPNLKRHIEKHHNDFLKADYVGLSTFTNIHSNEVIIKAVDANETKDGIDNSIVSAKSLDEEKTDSHEGLVTNTEDDNKLK